MEPATGDERILSAKKLNSMKCVLYVLFCTITISACKKANTVAFAFTPGKYTGTFQRQVLPESPVALITLQFSGDTWSGESNMVKYPALCSGTYKKSGNTISFGNACPWTAEFDWTLILSGDYEVKQKGDSLQIIKDYNGFFKDVYILKKTE